MANLASRYVWLAKETNFGATPGSPTKVYGEIDEESMKQEMELLDRADITRYGKRKTVIGMRTAGGELSMALQGDRFCGMLIGQVFGSNTHAGSGAPYTNTLAETDDESNFNSYTIGVGRDTMEHRYLGQVLDEISIGANVGEYVMLSATFLGAKEDDSGTSGPGSKGFALAAPTNSDLHTGDAFHFQGAKVNFESKLSGANYSEFVKSVEVSFSLGRDKENSYALASQTCTRAPPPTLREITGSIEFNRVINASTVADNEPHWDELLEGLLVDGDATNPAISLSFAGGTNESLEINIYKVQYETPDSNVSGRDTQTLSLSFYALFDEAVGAMSDALWTTTDANDITS